MQTRKLEHPTDPFVLVRYTLLSRQDVFYIAEATSSVKIRRNWQDDRDVTVHTFQKMGLNFLKRLSSYRFELSTFARTHEAAIVPQPSVVHVSSHSAITMLASNLNQRPHTKLVWKICVRLQYTNNRHTSRTTAMRTLTFQDGLCDCFGYQHGIDQQTNWRVMTFPQIQEKGNSSEPFLSIQGTASTTI